MIKSNNSLHQKFVSACVFSASFICMYCMYCTCMYILYVFWDVTHAHLLYVLYVCTYSMLKVFTASFNSVYILYMCVSVGQYMHSTACTYIHVLFIVAVHGEHGSPCCVRVDPVTGFLQVVLQGYIFTCGHCLSGSPCLLTLVGSLELLLSPVYCLQCYV